jgi:hypothetical protein
MRWLDFGKEKNKIKNEKKNCSFATLMKEK